MWVPSEGIPKMVAQTSEGGMPEGRVCAALWSIPTQGGASTLGSRYLASQPHGKLFGSVEGKQ
jgi:hypothetical protein